VESATSQREQDGVSWVRLRAPMEVRPQITRALVAANVDVFRMDRVVERLESIFLKLTHGKEAA